MSGFSPVGSAPVGAIGGTPPKGNAYTPASGSLQFTGSVPNMTGTAKIVPLVAGQMARELLAKPTGELAIAQMSRETILKPTGELAIAQMVREVLVKTSGGATATETIISIIW